MKAALLNGVALAAAFVVGIQPAAQEAPSAPGTCPWVARHVAEQREWMATQSPETPSEAPGREARPHAFPYSPGGHVKAPHPLETAECGDSAWKDFLVPSFDSQSACEDWVRENLTPRVLENLPPGESREFRFPQHETGGSAILRSGSPLLI